MPPQFKIQDATPRPRRLTIKFLIDDKEIIPIDIGTHDRVYEVCMESDEFLDFRKFRI